MSANKIGNESTESDDRLESKDKIDYLFNVINRFDFYINSTNAKASIIIAWNGIVIGTVLLKYDEIIKSYESVHWARSTVIVLLLFIGICSLLSNILVFSVVFPFLKPTNKLPTGKVLESESMLFFESVAKMGADGYHRRIADSDNNEILMDLADQATTIAYGLKSKMNLIQKSMIVLIIGIVLIFGLLIVKIIAV
jgi:hypothetical protein